MQGIIARKIDQTQKFLENGIRIPVTILDVADNTVVTIKTAEKDKYTAVQLGFGTRKKATRAVLGHAKKAHMDNAPWILLEIPLSDTDTVMNPGDTLKAIDTFKAGDIIQVTGFSKGKGFAGGVKRHGFKGGPRTHGQSDRERAPGSIGQTTTPGRVYKGKRMAGRMGSDKVTVTNLQVVAVDDATKTLMVKGLVPGFSGTFLTVIKTGEVSEKKFVPLLTNKKDAASTSNVAEADAVSEVTDVDATSNVAADDTAKVEEAQVEKEAETTEEAKATPKGGPSDEEQKTEDAKEGGEK